MSENLKEFPINDINPKIMVSKTDKQTILTVLVKTRTFTVMKWEHKSGLFKKYVIKMSMVHSLFRMFKIKKKQLIRPHIIIDYSDCYYVHSENQIQHRQKHLVHMYTVDPFQTWS